MAEGERFSGFPVGGRATAVPNLFFTAVLPRIEDMAELVVSVYFFFAWGRQRRYPRYYTYGELAGDATLQQALAHLAGGPEEALRRGLELAVRRGSLLRSVLEGDRGRRELYSLNTAAGRNALERLQRGEAAPAAEERAAEAWEPAPNIFAIYEENVGAISPLIAEELTEAETQYPAPWVEAAFREAVRQNKRSWRYIQKILERWAVEGPDYEEAGRVPERARRGQPLSGRYRRLVGR